MIDAIFLFFGGLAEIAGIILNTRPPEAEVPSWLPPFFYVLGAAMIVVALFRLRASIWEWILEKAKRRSELSLQKKIEFSWGPMPGDERVGTSGSYFVLTLAQVPEDVMRTGFHQVTTAPNTPVGFHKSTPSYKCIVANHSNITIFAAWFELECTFWEALHDAKSSTTVQSSGIVTMKGQGELILERKSRVTIPRLDPGQDASFVFYINNPNEIFARVVSPKSIQFKRLGEDSEEAAALIVSGQQELLVPPPMEDIQQQSETDSDGVYEGDHEKLMVFVANNLLPTLNYLGHLERAMFNAAIPNSDDARLALEGVQRRRKEFTEAYDRLSGLSGSPSEYIPLPEMIELVATLRKDTLALSKASMPSLRRTILHRSQLPSRRNFENGSRRTMRWLLRTNLSGSIRASGGCFDHAQVGGDQMNCQKAKRGADAQIRLYSMLIRQPWP